MGKEQEKKGLNISTKSFVTAIIVIFVLMVLTYVLTFIIPGGMYARTVDQAGNTVIDTTAGFTWVEGGIPFWKWILSPALVLRAEGNASLIAVLIFLLVIGGVFNSLDKCGLMKYMLDRITERFGRNRYGLMAVVSFFFMAMGSFIGSFEECVPLVPIVVALALRLGWDALMGTGMSLLAIGCGFAAGICNPFTVGVAQELAGLPMFSGIWMRLVSFLLIYVLLFVFLWIHGRRLDKASENAGSGVKKADGSDTVFQTNRQMDRGLLCFGGIMGLGILLVLSSAFVTVLQDYTMIIVAVMFLTAGIFATLISGMSVRGLGTTFVDGVASVLPAVLMILMANSIKYTLVEGRILDTVLYGAVQLADDLQGEVVLLFIYLLVLGLNFFIPSGSAKAFLLIPLIVPAAAVFGISPQLCILAFAFGDGFSNVFYPTNPVLLISLGLADISYGKWVKWSWKFQFLNLVLTGALLLFGLAVGY